MFHRKRYLDLIIKGYEDILKGRIFHDFPEFMTKFKKYKAERALLTHQIAFYHTINYQAVINNEISLDKPNLYRELMFYHQQITKIEAKIVNTIEQAMLV